MKKLLLLFLTLVGMVSSAMATEISVYLKPNSKWLQKEDGTNYPPRFAVYACNDGTGGEYWYDMNEVVGVSGYYYATIDAKYKRIIFVRMNGNTSRNEWPNKWNQTSDIDVFADNNLFVLNDAWDNPSYTTPSIYSVTPTTKFEFGISGQDGWTSVTLSGSNGVLTGTADLTSTLDNKNFGLNVTGYDFLNTGELSLEDPDELVTDGASTGSDFTLDNGNKSYKTYAITATWIPNEAAPNNWKLKVEGDDERGSTTYNITLNDEAGWNDVKVYTFYPDLCQSGTYESPDAMMNNGDGTWSYSKTFYEPYPQKVLFKKDSSNKTDDLYLTNDHTYSNDGTTKYYVIGNISEFGNFDQTETTALMTVGHDGVGTIHTYSIENLDLTSGTVEYKILQRKYAEQVESMTYYPTGTNNNKEITISENGKYNLYIQYNDYWDRKDLPTVSSYDLSLVSVPVEVTSAGYATFVSTHDLDYTDASIKAYTAKVNTGNGNVVLSQIDKVPANTPVILHKAGGATEDIPAATTTDNPEASDLVAGTGSGVASTADSYCNYILNVGSSGIGFYWANGQTVATNRAYLHTTYNVHTPGARLSMVFADETTGIKSIDNGQLMMDNYYDLQGRRVMNPTKGLYIINGKKVIR